MMRQNRDRTIELKANHIIISRDDTIRFKSRQGRARATGTAGRRGKKAIRRR